MILIEDTHWPLVVVGVCCGPRLDEACLDRARMRWQSREFRRALFVVPGSGPCALCAYELLTRWLKRESMPAALCRSAAWVIPDESVRASVNLMLDVDGHLMFSGPAATFATVAAAFGWMRELARREESAWPIYHPSLSNCHSSL
jgi:hypothetical protein